MPEQAFCVLVRLAGIEPTTPWFVAKYSIQLSYSRQASHYSAKARVVWQEPGGPLPSRPMNKRSSSGGLVYSTDFGTMCPGCRQPVAQCVCKAASVPAGDGVVRVQRSTQGRGGKTVTAVRGVPLAAPELQALGKRLKAACGSGGTTKDGVIEVQGDHVERAMAWLQAQGYTVKRSGG